MFSKVVTVSAFLAAQVFAVAHCSCLAYAQNPSVGAAKAILDQAATLNQVARPRPAIVEPKCSAPDEVINYFGISIEYKCTGNPWSIGSTVGTTYEQCVKQACFVFAQAHSLLDEDSQTDCNCRCLAIAGMACQ